MKNINDQKRIPEILAPAGTPEAMMAAVNAGCDAVYMGGSLFGARAYAGNFDTQEMVNAIERCHLFDIRVYMTVNTLLKENEISNLIPYMIPYYEAGLDGVIVQDMGVVRMLRSEFPDLHIHASTQMSIASEYGARLMKRLGLTRIVPARELSLEELISIKQNVDIEIESFVHGAMCYAYSGKCLFSSFFGGRSGNRGRCAQPCRQKYYMEGCRSFDRSRPYVLSLKDMCMLSSVPLLTDAGIDSFKIEGRMKNPYYVAAVTDAYRQARDRYLEMREKSGNIWQEMDEKYRSEYISFTGHLTENMQDIYNRGGFHTGYYFTNKGLEMAADERPNHDGLAVGKVSKVIAPQIEIKLCRDVNMQDVLEIREANVELTSGSNGAEGGTLLLKAKELKKIKPGMTVYRTRNNSLLNEIDNNIIKKEKKISADALVEAHVGEPLKITLTDDSGQISVYETGNTVEKAGSKPVSAMSLAEKMGKTGGTNLEITVRCEVDEDAFVAMSDFNNVRRAVMDKYKKALSSRYCRTI